MMKFKHAMLHIKEHYPIVYKHWPKSTLRKVVAHYMWMEKYGFKNLS